MKAVLCENYGTPSELVIKEIPRPRINEHQVLIAVSACGLNFPDTLIIQGKYQFKPTLPFSPGGEVAGTILQTGDQVKHLKEGMRVLALCGWGGFAEELVVDANRVFPLPGAIDFPTAAGTLYSYGTSYYALKQKAMLQAGETILILGAGGGVGHAAVELAKLMGAKVIACAASEEKLAACRKLGADHTINYTSEDLRKKIQEYTNGKGIDIVFDPVGGQLAEQSIRSLCWKGRYLVIGFASGEIPNIPLNLALLKGSSLIGVFWGSFAEKEPAENAANMMELSKWLIEGKLQPAPFKVYPLEQAAEAIQDLTDRKIIGKALIQIREWPEKKPIPKQEIAPAISDLPKEKSEQIPQVFKDKYALKEGIGKPLGTSPWLIITQERINQFAEATMDHQWVHTDLEKAKKFLPGGKTIAHGYLTLSLVSQFLYQLVFIEQIQSFVNYGINKARFINPVPVGAEIRLSASIKNVEELPNTAVKLFLECSIEIKGQNKPAYVAEIISMIF